jgi:hypothetical protein
MITTCSSPRWLQVTSATVPYINTYSGNLNIGQLRYNPQTLSLEVYDGLAWQRYPSTSQVDLTQEAQETLMWARNKMLEEQRIESLMAQHPGLRDLHERFQVMLALVQTNETKID